MEPINSSNPSSFPVKPYGRRFLLGGNAKKARAPFFFEAVTSVSPLDFVGVCEMSTTKSNSESARRKLLDRINDATTYYEKTPNAPKTSKAPKANDAMNAEAPRCHECRGRHSKDKGKRSIE